MSTNNSAASTYLTPTTRNAVQIAQWKESLRQAMCELRVGIPGIVVSFDSTLQTATVQIAVREKIQLPTSAPAPAKGFKNVTIEPIDDVPVIMPRGGGFTLTVPLQAGDECWLMFSDMTIDTWWAAGGVQNQYQFESPRHDISDVVCLPGPWSKPRKLASYATDAMQMRADDGSAIIDIASDASGAGVSSALSSMSLTNNLCALESSEITVTANVASTRVYGDLYAQGNLFASTGASGTFSTSTGQTVTVQNGIVIDIS